jgi:hypothetical protein
VIYTFKELLEFVCATIDARPVLVPGSEPTLADIRVEAKSLEAIVPEYLTAWRRRA